MPIKFRCPHCSQFLGISRQSAGSVVDCPACGRTIRVPHEDGRIDPLPDAKLDLQDAAIVRALEEIAAVEPSAAGRGPVILERKEEPPRPRDIIPAPLRAPIEAPPLAMARPSDEAPVDVEAALLALAADPTARSRTSSPVRTGRRQALTALATAAVCGPVGWWLGRRSSQSSSRVDLPIDPVAEIAAQPSPAAVPAEDQLAALRGRVTWLAPDGEARPDAGARVFALPESRPGTARLPIDGFRSGASAADRQLARESLRLLGGGFASADEDGRYQLELASSGTYHLLIVSRYQSRDDRGGLPEEVARILGQFFERPTMLIGAVRYDFSRFRYSGRVSALRDHVFDRA